MAVGSGLCLHFGVVIVPAACEDWALDGAFALRKLGLFARGEIPQFHDTEATRVPCY